MISIFFFILQNVSENPFERVEDVTTILHFKDFAEKFNKRLQDLNSTLHVVDLKKYLGADKYASTVSSIVNV